jgi:hypothetical protein
MHADIQRISTGAFSNRQSLDPTGESAREPIAALQNIRVDPWQNTLFC